MANFANKFRLDKENFQKSLRRQLSRLEIDKETFKQERLQQLQNLKI